MLFTSAGLVQTVLELLDLLIFAAPELRNELRLFLLLLVGGVQTLTELLALHIAMLELSHQLPLRLQSSLGSR